MVYDPSIFHRSLVYSVPAVTKMAGWYSVLGYEVKMAAMWFRVNRTDWMGREDSPDLLVKKEGKPVEAIEVKRVAAMFTNADDYPYPSIRVEGTYKIDRKPIRPKGYWIVRKDLRFAAWLPMSCFHTWTRQVHDEPQYERKQEFWHCPISQARWHDLCYYKAAETVIGHRIRNWEDGDNGDHGQQGHAGARAGAQANQR